MKMRKAAAAAAVSIALAGLAGCGLFNPEDNTMQNAYGPPPPEYWDEVYGTPGEDRGDTDEISPAETGESTGETGESSDDTGETVSDE